MTNEEWENLCLSTFKKFANEKGNDIAKYKGDITYTDEYFDGNSFIVWNVKNLQNRKSIVCGGGANQLLMEMTYNGDKKETYVDVYKKLANFVIKNGD